MNLAWSTAAILALLLPGFFFLKGVGFAERFSRDAAPRSPTAQLAFAVLVSILAHAFALAALRWLHAAPLDLRAALLLISGHVEFGEALGAVLPSISGHIGLIALYFLLVSVLGFGCGWLLGWLACICPWLRAVVFEHAWLHDLSAERVKPLAYALTDLSVSGSLMIYVGELHRFGVRQDGRFAYLILRRASRALVARAEADQDGARLAWSKIRSEDHDDWLYLDGESVKNVFFKPSPIGPLEHESSQFIGEALQTLRSEIDNADQTTK